MKNQNFYLRLIALLLIIMAVFFYNGTAKDKEQAQNIADLSAKVENLEKQQEQILTALQETYEEQKSSTSSESSDDQSAKDETAKKMQHLQTQKNLPMILIMCIKMELMKDPEQDMAVRSPYR